MVIANFNSLTEMKVKKQTALVVGAVTLGTLLAAGCHNEVMSDRSYVPLDKNEAAASSTATPAASSAALTESKQPAVAAAKTYAPIAPVAKEDFSSTSDAGAGSYVVKKGDTLSKIAAAHGIGWKVLAQANKISDPSKIKVGQTLVIPSKGEAISGGHKVGSGKGAVKSSGKGAKAVVGKADVSAEGIYVVKDKDTIPGIAKKLGVKRSELMAVNNLDDAATRKLQVGQKLKVPGKASATAVVGSPATDTKVTVPEVKVEAPVADIDVNAGSADTAAKVETPVVAVDSAATSNGSTPVEVRTATTVEEFAKAYNTTAEELKRLNPDEFPKDGKTINPGILFVPVKK